jgi:hypothetical protein
MNTVGMVVLSIINMCLSNHGLSQRAENYQTLSGRAGVCVDFVSKCYYTPSQTGPTSDVFECVRKDSYRETNAVGSTVVLSIVNLCFANHGVKKVAENYQTLPGKAGACVDFVTRCYSTKPGADVFDCARQDLQRYVQGGL